MRRIDINGDGEAQGPCGAHLPAVSRSAAGETVIPFPRDRAAASSDLAAAGDPPSDPAATNFVPLGDAVLPVVLRLANKRILVKLAPAPAREKDRGEP